MIRIFLGFCLLAATACGGKEDIPDDVIAQDKMTNILIDIYITEARVDNYMPRLSRDSAVMAFHILKEDIMEKHNISDSVFEKSMQWYFENPQQLDIVYERVVDSINLKLQQNRTPEEQGP